jgi:tRNA threonylcarbamoyladenosine biosynthesis protein TsaE
MSTSDPEDRIVLSGSPEETEAIGRRVGRRCRGGELLALIGELGAGKTRFVKGLALGLGVEPSRVTSPTFVIHQSYAGTFLRLEHVDAYRLAGPADWQGLSLEDWHGVGAVLAVEWADRIEPALPRDRLGVRFEIRDEKTRSLAFSAAGAGHRHLLAF